MRYILRSAYNLNRFLASADYFFKTRRKSFAERSTWIECAPKKRLQRGNKMKETN